ncbi:MAG: bifunctional oligoribonuclease/PAP phosphatase NrnA [Clostridia bacterium]
MLTDAVRFIRAHDDILLIAHVSPDGDTLGSSLALYGALLQLGKRAQIVCEDSVPRIYRFLPNAGQVLLPENARQTEAVISVDCADLARTGKSQLLFCSAAYTLNIDHHGTNDRYATENYVQKAGATGELVLNILTNLKVNVTKDIAACLYAAITTDTGNFSYSNTTPDTLRNAAELLECGIDLPYLNRMVFRTVPFHKMRLHGLAIMKTELYERGRIGISMLTEEDLKSCGATGEDMEGIIDSIRDIDTVEIAAMLRESSDGLIRVSLRGKSAADVSKIAVRYGGGGHKLAAGCTMQPPIADAASKILTNAMEILHGADL